MSEMTPKEMAAFLEETHLAHLVTLKRDGSPHVAPVWYQYRDGNTQVMAVATAVKCRNLARDPRVAVSIAADREPYRYVLMEGTGQVSRERLKEVVLSICLRYRGEERGRKYALELENSQMVIVAVCPTKVITWTDEG